MSDKVLMKGNEAIGEAGDPAENAADQHSAHAADGIKPESGCIGKPQ